MGEIHFLNVGHGDCTIIKSASNRTIIIDCAERIDNYPHLLPQDKRIAAVFITHRHYDHFKGLRYLRDNGYYIENLIYSPYEASERESNFVREQWTQFERLRNWFRDRKTKLFFPQRQKNFTNPWKEMDGIKFYILGPAEHLLDRKTDLHNGCLVILAELGDRKCLFTGDASNASLKYIADHRHPVYDDILHASHHGSNEGADAHFVRLCNPTLTIISTGPSIENFPHFGAMMIYRQYTKKGNIVRTDQMGYIESHMETW